MWFPRHFGVTIKSHISGGLVGLVRPEAPTLVSIVETFCVCVCVCPRESCESLGARGAPWGPRRYLGAAFFFADIREKNVDFLKKCGLLLISGILCRFSGILSGFMWIYHKNWNVGGERGYKKKSPTWTFFLLFLKFFKRFSIRYISFRGLLFSRVIFYMAFFEYMM